MSGWNLLLRVRSNQRRWLSALSCWFLLQSGRSQGSHWILQPGSVHTLLRDRLVLKKGWLPVWKTQHFIFILTGYWCPPGQTIATAFPCPPGHFCSQGSASPVLCPSGFYQDREKQASCTVCEAGRKPSLPSFIL